jgi:hypothetical protein
MAWRDRLLTTLIGHDKVSSERATRRYLEDVHAAFCQDKLDEALRQLLHGIDEIKKIFSFYATTNSRGKRDWNRDSFARYINTRLPQNAAVNACVPLLWRIFSTCAYFPFSAPVTMPDQVPGPPNEQELDLKKHSPSLSYVVTIFLELCRMADLFQQPEATITPIRCRDSHVSSSRA